jgi:hypothetical protein
MERNDISPEAREMLKRLDYFQRLTGGPYLQSYPSARRMRATVIKRTKARNKRLAVEQAQALEGAGLADFQPLIDALTEYAKEAGKQ